MNALIQPLNSHETVFMCEKLLHCWASYLFAHDSAKRSCLNFRNKPHTCSNTSNPDFGLKKKYLVCCGAVKINEDFKNRRHFMFGK